MEKSIKGKRVKILAIGTGDSQEYYNFANKPDLIATVVNTFHGDHDFDWIVVEKDGKETMRIGINQNCIIQWWEA